MTSNNSSWTKVVSKTTDYLLAVIVANVLLAASAKPLELLGFEAIASAVVISVLVVFARHRKQFARRLSSATMIGARWTAAIIAGTMFSIGYSILVLSLPIGLLAITLYFALVVLAIRLIELLGGSILGKFSSSQPGGPKQA